MKNRLFLTLALGIVLGVGANGSMAQSTVGSQGGSVIPGIVKQATPNAAAGSPGSEPENSLSTRGSFKGTPREGDVMRQIGILAPVAFVLFLVLAGGLYWFVFRKPTTPEGEAASTGTNKRNAV